ncbi:MmgE/PrpD family protein [Pukyongiella litopenaei]|uniref:MmgE/PrpD family protein n=1 Tax=Pukyongiella litopenaei TaxID=2605946 RepID=A0A2S0MU63_9RHOB|nr:MmgE/PrpD family protein [Pukyongiella litopenaei]AVO39440.1 MmgE/PrpD family protein [Pukyongiella litopenaei]
MTDSFTETLAGLAAGPVETTPLARLVTQLSALDWIAVGRAGAGEPVSRIVRDMALDDGGAGAAHLFGTATMAPLRQAALVNGTISHALDYDDTHFAHIGHPSVAVFSAAVAMGEARGAGLAEMLEAALVGMELSVRLGLWLGRPHYQAGFHMTATAGAFGAAAAAARLAGLDAAATAMALGLTATRASGLKAQFGTMGKPYNAGIAASTGIESVLLVQRGFVANPVALEGEFGFGATHHGQSGRDDALAGLGRDWLFEQVSHKFHACCHGLHAALEAGRELDVAAPEIARLTVRTHPRWMSVCNQPAPITGLGAKFSYRTVLAMQALGHDTARLDSYADHLCADPRVIDLRDRIMVEVDGSLAETEARLEVLRRDGARFEARHDLSAPMTPETREDRVRGKAAGLIGADMAQEVWSMLSGGGDVAGFAALMSA